MPSSTETKKIIYEFFLADSSYREPLRREFASKEDFGNDNQRDHYWDIFTIPRTAIVDNGACILVVISG